ncbi:hypothetical protein LCGC14_0303150 [marine sediment metagenome]|uniref:Uncharacterized protein n=1 Tax=marine sediment metagenome TaxID=412755 RepID=A0A0F9TUN4_9ZZZZ
MSAISNQSRFFDLLDFLLLMEDRGWLKQDSINLIKEAYFYTHGETKEEEDS